MKKFLAFVLFILWQNTVQSQHSFDGIRESNYGGALSLPFNPAFIADSRYKLDFVLGGANIAGYNNFIGLKNASLLKMATNSEYANTIDSAFVAQNAVFKKGDNRRLYLNADLQMLSFTFPVSHIAAIGFNWRVRSFVNVDGVTGDLANIIYNEIKDSLQWGMNLDNEKLSVQTMSYAEYAGSFAINVMDKGEHFMKVGATLKLLQGLQAAYFYVDDLSYNFSNDTTLSLFQSHVNYGHSSNFEVGRDNVKYKFVSNPGIGFDVGAVYEYRPDYKEYKYEMDGQDNLWRKDKNKYKFRAALAITDVGRVKFQKGDLSADFNADINFWNLHEFDTINSVGGFDSLIQQKFQQLSDDKRDFLMNLPTAFNINLDYSLGKNFYLGHTTFIAMQFTNNRDKVHYYTNFNLIPRYDYKNIGVALPLSYSTLTGFRPGFSVRTPVLMFGTSDLRAFFKSPAKYGADFFVALKFHILNRHPKDSDGDKVSDKLDLCKDVRGVWAFKGCPDTDGDMIQDSEDECPAEAGLLEFKGCPDTDRDGIPDKLDSCPNEFGLKEFNGCPDTDADGIPDKEDDCPLVQGIKEFKGCPDTDKDGVMDKEDNCPLEPGPKENNGCPEFDKLYLVDEYGDIKAIAKLNDKGLYIFENLPLDKSYLFMLEAKDNVYSEKIDIIVINNGKEKTISAKLNQRGYYEYTYLKPVEIKLDEKKTDEVTKIELNKEEEEILNTAFNNLEFETAKAIIKDVSYASLVKLVELMKKKPEWSILIAGHTDSDGEAARNLILSKRRAEAVATFLESNGITKARIITEWYGETKPIADNNTPEGKQKNRRVEMTIVKK
jgi:outer membrane protein OmpA-like peptidoglycan-associated protein